MSRPVLSIIVIGYNMAAQLQRTLFSLSTAYQLNVSATDYEVLVIENESDNMISESYVKSLGSNFRYFRRQETGQSPVPAINFGFDQCQGSLVGLMIDGAYLVTPRVIHYALVAHRAITDPVIVVPGYHLGDDLHENNRDSGHDEEREAKLIQEIRWPENGYRLFEISTFSYANRHGIFHPIMECNCLFAPLLSFARIGFCDSRFTLRGGGSVNLHMYRQLGTLPESQIVVLPGEGAFHQFHGGVSTSQYEARQAEIEAHNLQLSSFWENNFQAVRKEPLLLGAVTQWAQPILEISSVNSQRRSRRLASLGREEWEDQIFPNPVRPHLSKEQAEALLKTRHHHAR